MRLLEGDERVAGALATGGVLVATDGPDAAGLAQAADAEPGTAAVLATAARLRWEIGNDLSDQISAALFDRAALVAGRCLSRQPRKHERDLSIDRLVTSRLFGVPLMIALLAIVFWVTLEGANYPSAFLFSILIERGHPFLHELLLGAGLPWWFVGVVIDGMYMATAWVVSVMLPPMAIFFPLFTLLEDLGYLPRVAFNLDNVFRRAGGHGKQALTMCMGFGCNAAGVVAPRIIDSPRERLLAIVTNNFSLCNGRWPTQFLIASVFIGALVRPALSGLVAAAAVVAVALFGILLTFVVSWTLSRTVLRGQPSAFTLELPPYRPPQILRTLYTSFIDRTVFVLWRALVFALPAGAFIWIIANVAVGDATLAEWFVGRLDPLAVFIGLNGVIMLAFLVAIPANEIVIPTVLMLTILGTGAAGGIGTGAGVMFDAEASVVSELLHGAGWTTLTAVSLLLFSLVHNPCSTTIYTIWKETRSVRWTLTASLLPLLLGFVLCGVLAQIWYLVPV
jgi:ferrous iron transport protein B